MKRDPLEMPAIRLEFTLADGSKIERDFTMADSPNPRALQNPPSWLTGRSRRWDHPQDPITFAGSVVAGHEDEARAYVEAL